MTLSLSFSKYELSDPERRIFEAIRNTEECLKQDLLKSKQRKKLVPGCHPLTGHCFVATLATYHLIGVKCGLKPYFLKTTDDGTHWWLWNKDSREYLDPTFEQVTLPFPYDKGTYNPGIAKQERNRSGKLISRVEEFLKKINDTKK